MLELKINKKDISLDPFEIVAWEDQELALALFATKPIGKEEDRSWIVSVGNKPPCRKPV